MARIVRMAGFGAIALMAASPALAQMSVGISVQLAPPPLPVYEQPPLPGPDYVWTPGYWAWDELANGYYWVPGVWMLAPRPGLLWTPPWWGWQDGAYFFHSGYWGPHVGFYGGVHYGFGYTGMGFQGGYWRGDHFAYNSSVTNITNVHVTNVYRQNVVVNHVTRISYNGGPGGVTARPTPQEMLAGRDRHMMPMGRPIPPMASPRAKPGPGSTPPPPFAARAMAEGGPMPVVHRGQGEPGYPPPPRMADRRQALFTQQDAAWRAPPREAAPSWAGNAHPMHPPHMPARPQPFPSQGPGWGAPPHGPPRMAFHPAPRPQPVPRPPHMDHHERR